MTTVERVGGYELRIVRAPETAESRRRWGQRSEAIAAWLLARWREQQRQRTGTDADTNE